MKKLIMAPMATLSHEAFRRCVARFGGCDEYFTEMINAGSLLNMGPWEKFYLRTGPEPEKIVWQLTGTTPEKMGEAAKILVEQTGLGLDLNMGCSAPQIYKTGAGISWMLKPIEETEKMVRLVKKAIDDSTLETKKRFSVKLRLGDEDYTKEGFFDFCKMLIDNGVQMLTLHARTKKEKYRGDPKWAIVEELAQKFPEIPVVLNGAITDVRSYEKAVNIAPSCSAVMIARMVAQKPWIFRMIKNSQDPNAQKIEIDCEQVALDFVKDVEECQPKEFWRTRIQRFFTYYCLNFSFAHLFQTRMLNAKDNEEAKNKIKEYFFKNSNDKIKYI